MQKKQQGKYESTAKRRISSAESKAQKHLFRALVSSVVSMILCMTMFLSTTMAWFTDTVESAGNQITVGELKVDVRLGGPDGTSLKENTNTPIFAGGENGVVWKPGHHEVRVLTVENKGNLDIKYALNFRMPVEAKSRAVDIARYLQVYVKDITDSGISNYATYAGNVSLDEIRGAGSSWTVVGKSADATLMDIFNGGVSAVDGELPAAAAGKSTAKTYAIALYMTDDVASDLQGMTLNLNIILNAYQSNAPEAEVEVGGLVDTYTGELEEAIEFDGGTLILNNVTLNAPAGEHAITIKGNTRLIIEGTTSLTAKDAKTAIYVNDGVKLDLSGDTLIAVGNGGIDSEAGGHGIGGYGEIYIHDLKNLTAKGFGKHAFGIGGPSKSITIVNTHITEVQGGYVQQNFVNDLEYGKTELEGGAAIGSHTDGAVITLSGVTIDKALGGSKAAGIGAMHWTSVDIHISDSTISKVVGGNASAGIGGSRIQQNNNGRQAVSISIADSTINAEGGQYGAGIGSGYDTYCQSPGSQPVHTINITGNSVITAKGGKYAAGIGTGYHVAALAGKIESTVTVNATAGESRDKYTKAMDVGFGVFDHAKEGAEANTSSFDYKGTVITVATPELAASGV